MKKQLVRSSTDNMLAGICGGIAAYFDLNPTLVRILYILVSVMSAGFPGTLVYIILWFVIPKDTAVNPEQNVLKS